MENPDAQNRPEPSRRDFLAASGAALAGLSVAAAGCAAAPPSLFPVRFGLVTDLHYADREPANTRHYRDSLDKLAEAVAHMNGAELDFAVDLGDLKDQDEPPVEARTQDYLRRIEGAFKGFQGPRYHVLGNHDMDSLSKDQFQAEIENTGIPMDQTFYSFDRKGLHGVVLDACHRSDGTPYDHGDFDWTDANVPAAQLDWLKKDLAAAKGFAIVFAHQRLDGEGKLFVKNAAEVRAVLEESGKVLAVFQGHDHPGAYNLTNGIHYYTLKAMVEGPGKENNAYAVAELDATGALTITGHAQAASKTLPA